MKKMLLTSYFLSKKSFYFFVLLILLSVAGAKSIAKTPDFSEPETAEYQSNLGAYHWQKGDFSSAIDAWESEAQIYRQQGESDREAEATLKITQSYISLGQVELAIFHLKKILSLTQDSSFLARAWGQLGNAYSSDGELDKAVSAYNKSLDLETNLSTINNLIKLKKKQLQTAQLKVDSAKEGKEKKRYLAEAELYHSEALKYAKSALLLSQNEESTASFVSLIEWGNLSATGLTPKQLQRGRNILANLPNSRIKVYLGINWSELDSEQAEYWLSQAQKVTEITGDRTAKSYVLLELALLAEKAGDLTSALKYAQLAREEGLSQSVYDILYRSYWLTGRITKHYGDKEAALKNYRNAIVFFERLNQGLKKINVEQRLNFSTQVEPMYRTALELLLEAPIPSDSTLKESLLIFDKLRLAQLQNYFGDNCLNLQLKNSDSTPRLKAKNAVLLNSIILENQTHFILELADGTLRHSRVSMSKTALSELASDFYNSMNIDSDNFLEIDYSFQIQKQREELYNVIIRPFEPELQQINPSTLIFVHDGVLRNIPMGALHDGEKFLAEKWASVSSLGLDVELISNPNKVLKAAAFGLGVAREGWSELDKVSEEVEEVIEIVGGKKILNQAFTSEKFFQQVARSEYPVIHIATHGYFGGVAENSFILAYDKSLTALDIENAINQGKVPIQLVVLSACETSFGSDLSILGLAGVALRSGVNSVLGSYWAIQDAQQPDLIKQFYSNINQNNLDKAQALQEIQITQIKQKANPSKWASFNLIENW